MKHQSVASFRRCPYRKSNKLIPEDWQEEIRIEEERRLKQKPKYLSSREFFLIQKEIEYEEFLEENPHICKHKEKFWYHDTHPQLLCKECHVILEERKILLNDVGYGFRNHIKSGRKG